MRRLGSVRLGLSFRLRFAFSEGLGQLLGKRFFGFLGLVCLRYADLRIRWKLPRFVVGFWLDGG